MSTYFYFTCGQCQVYGGFFSRQAWGWGNFDIIRTFKFLAKHVDNCGAEHIGVISEHEATDDDCHEDYAERLPQFLEETKGYFPSSDDWKFMHEHAFDDPPVNFQEAWQRREKQLGVEE